jgi:predicted amidophosphoribosyltransferase
MTVNLKQLFGNWDDGYALDKHIKKSTYAGENQWGRATFNNIRSDAGEAVYQLKYNHDDTQAARIAKAIATYILPKFPEIDLIVPMPASTTRAVQPVDRIVEELSKHTKIQWVNDLLNKTRTEQKLKDLGSKTEKQAVLEGTITLNDTLDDDNWTVLVVDDLFDSGASMEAVTVVLRGYSKISGIYVASATWK